jgi:hypothetical protein
MQLSSSLPQLVVYGMNYGAAIYATSTYACESHIKHVSIQTGLSFDVDISLVTDRRVKLCESPLIIGEDFLKLFPAANLMNIKGWLSWTSPIAIPIEVQLQLPMAIWSKIF